MASIQQTKYGFRAQIKVREIRESRSFKTREEAERWSVRRERDLGTVSRMKDIAGKAKRDWANLQKSHKDVTKEKILRWSKPVEEVIGIYFLIFEEEIVYVGQSKSCHKRVDNHRKTKIFDRYTILECDKDQLDHLEMMFIEEFSPLLNINGFNSGVADRYQHSIMSSMLGIN
jgi:hypothetical protein